MWCSAPPLSFISPPHGNDQRQSVNGPRAAEEQNAAPLLGRARAPRRIMQAPGARATMTSVQAWRMLRTPFCMPERCLGAHVCEWERIDVDKSGCRLCSHVHVCGYGTCTMVTETCDSLVCEISGLCVRTSNISDTGFSDEVISYGAKTAYSGDARDIYDDIEVHVAEMLLSGTAREVAALERAHHATKIGHAVQRASSRADVSSVVDAVEHALRTATERKRYDHFDAAARSRVAAVCSQQLRSAIPICSKHLNLSVRRSDMRVVVFGLLYLMRSGVTIHDICVLPCIDELTQMLPNESNLLKYYTFRSKHITGVCAQCSLAVSAGSRADECCSHAQTSKTVTSFICGTCHGPTCTPWGSTWCGDHVNQPGIYNGLETFAQ